MVILMAMVGVAASASVIATRGAPPTRKVVAGPVRKAGGERTHTFCISSGAVDRDNDTINPRGWDTVDFLRNPVILWAHDYGNMPVGRGSNFRVVGDNVFLDITFADTDEGNACLAMVEAGFLNACSVGFSPQESSWDAERGGTNFLRQALLEVSIVPVPANQDALVQRARTLGLSASVVRKMFGPTTQRKDSARFSDEDAALIEAIHDHVVALGSPCRDAGDDDGEETLSFAPDVIAAARASAARAGSAGADAARRRSVDDPSKLNINIDLATFKAATMAALPGIVKDIIKTEVDRALRLARGRVD